MRLWIFDLDGVITDLQLKKIINPNLLPTLSGLLEKGDAVALNTGRGLPFIRQQVLSPLRTYLLQHHQPESLLHKFMAVGEKGNAWIKDETDNFDMGTAVPKDFTQEVKSLVERNFADTMFFDQTKRTMISLEMHTGLDLDLFAKATSELLPLLDNLLQKHRLKDSYKLDPTVSAVDIEHLTSGKARGTDRILRWLDEKGFTPVHITTFGDSLADLGMGEALQASGKPFTFVFAGDPIILPSTVSFPIIFTKERYDKGALNFLKTV